MPNTTRAPAVRDLAGWMSLAFRMTHEISEAALDLEQSPALAPHCFYGTQVSDAGVSALAHFAAAYATYSIDYVSRMEAARSLAGARVCLSSLKRLLARVERFGYIEPERAATLHQKIDEACAVLMALGVELRGGSHRMRRAG